jgi:hypothetical protein
MAPGRTRHVPVEPRRPLCGRRARRASSVMDDRRDGDTRWRPNPDIQPIKRQLHGGWRLPDLRTSSIVGGASAARAEDGGGVEEFSRGALCRRISITT